MKKEVNRTLFVPIILILILGCERNPTGPSTSNIDTTLPPITTRGNNTFGCIFDSKLWLKENYSSISGEYGHGYMVITMKRTEIKNNDIIMIRTPNNSVFRSGVYNFDSENINAYYRKGESYYYTNDSLGGILEITKLDSINFILSGKFKFKAVDLNNNVVTIDSGRFDVKYIN